MVTKGTGRKTQIVDEATRLFSTEGYEGLTMKSLARACGVSEPALYRHFKSKEEIYEAVLESIADRLDNEDLFRQLETEDNLQTLLSTLAHHIIGFYTRNADLYRLLLFSALNGHARAKQVYNIIRGSYVRFLVEQLDRLHQAGLIIEKNNEITARCFIGMVFDCSLATTLWKGLQGKVYKPTDVVANNIPIYARGLQT